MRGLHRQAGAPRSPSSASPTPISKRRVDTSDEWIVERTGIRERRYRRRRARPPRASRIEAGAAAIKQAGLASRPTSTCSSSRPRPPSSRSPTPARSSATASACAAVPSTSAPAARASSTSSSIGRVAAHAGAYDHVLVVGAETLSPHHRSRTTAAPCILFGDGAAGVVLVAVARRRRPACSPGTSAATARPPDLLEIPAGGSRLPATPDTVDERPPLHEDAGPGGVPPRGAGGRRLGERSRSNGPGVAAADVDWFVPHQANVRIIEAAAKPPRRSRRSARSSTSTATATRRRRRSRSRCSKRSTTAASATATSCCCSGFGAGMTWGSALIRWGRA